ncbi:MAG: nuclear transport factor 2 family protein [Gammaproteobacteria bacterium]
MPSATDFATPEDTEAAFYRAFAETDLRAMMQVWAELDEVACIHPMGQIVHGYEQVRDSWHTLLGGDQRMHFRLEHHARSNDGTLAVHTLSEYIYLPGDTRPRPAILATNVYRRTAQGWRMVLHHASPSVIDTAGRQSDTPRQPLH